MDRNLQRIIQESVPGKQITIAHVIASPMPDIYDRLGMEETEAIGILTITPYEAAIIAADVATKAADVTIGFLDRFTGSLVICGDVQSVETALGSVCDMMREKMEFTVVSVTKS